MTFVVLLKGVNIGGHRIFRPSTLAKELKDANVVNVGAAGTFVVRKAISRSIIREEILRRLPFKTEIMILGAREVLRLIASDPFAGQIRRPNIVRFVSVMAPRRKPVTHLPHNLPSSGRWSVRILSCQGRFVTGMYRREMKAIRYLGQLEKIIGTPITTRNWNTLLAIGNMLRP
ncbi:MAG TPA: DUF1697 domain-containing protein [Nitrospirota bacterium]|nr:DUF1697 domain-containing protein [Nitrospirota bacterium]